MHMPGRNPIALGIGAVRRVGEALLDLVYPPTCGGCGRAGMRFCSRCTARVAWLDTGPFCLRCGRPTFTGTACPWCQTAPPLLDAIRSAALFVGPLRQATHAFKYTGRADLAEPLAGLMVAFWERHPLPADLIVPVPLHPNRQRERGFNQAGLLAQAFAARTGLPLAPQGLARIRETAPQVGLNVQERRDNVRGAFCAQGEAFVGRRPLLIDDVCTTGATLEACARALHSAGSQAVYALTLARADFSPAG